VTVVDSLAPCICCPSDMSLYTCSNSIVVKWAAPRVLDNCSSGLQAACFHLPVRYSVLEPPRFHAPRRCLRNVGTCSFQVRVVGEQLVYATKQLGSADCFRNSYEDAPKSKALLSVPVSAWKPSTAPRRRRGLAFPSIS